MGGFVGTIADELRELQERKKRTDLRLREVERKMQQLEKSSSEKTRKERNRDLIAIGALAEIAGLRGIDRGALLGGFYALRIELDNAQNFQRWKEIGDAEMFRREQARKNKIANSS